MGNKNGNENEVRALLWIVPTDFGTTIHINQLDKLKGAQKKVFSRFGTHRAVVFKHNRSYYGPSSLYYRAMYYFGNGESDPRQNLNLEIITSDPILHPISYLSGRVITLPQGLVYSEIGTGHEDRLNRLEEAISLVNNPSLGKEDLMSLCEKWYLWEDGRIKRNRERLSKYLNRKKKELIKSLTDPYDKKEIARLRATWEYWKDATHHDKSRKPCVSPHLKRCGLFGFSG